MRYVHYKISYFIVGDTLTEGEAPRTALAKTPRTDSDTENILSAILWFKQTYGISYPHEQRVIVGINEIQP